MVEEIECSVCGREGQPPKECKICHGNAQTQSLAYTLSDHRANRAPKEDRYGDTGTLGPKIVTLPGSALPTENNG
jgi:hypothetical protein